MERNREMGGFIFVFDRGMNGWGGNGEESGEDQAMGSSRSSTAFFNSAIR